MSPRRLIALFTFHQLLFTALRADFPTPTNNQPETIPLTPPEKTIGMMHLPPGFKATLYAAEPDVQQPIAMCWDERGRLWVAENYTYSDGKERFDMKLKDRILIFEDTDNDGHFDKRTVFADDLQMLTSIERGFGGVYALCPPHLLWIPTKDDKPSGPPQVLLDGFCTTAGSKHTFANGLKWGPDGWLYGRVGISSTSWVGVPGDGSADTPVRNQANGDIVAKSNEADRSVRAPIRKPTAGGVWRYHPTRKIYEPYCHGTTNPWGMDWDEHGEMFFINTVIGHLWHGIQGAHFKRMHGEDPYPHIYGLIDQHADHYHWDTGKKWNETREAKGLTDELGGGHAHVGMMIYQGTNFPKEYRGKVFTTNLHGHRVNVDRIEREGSGYVGKHEPDFMKTDDPWFRAVEIQYGPDGGVYILDWSDIGECHEDDGVHRTSGRIYKITYGDAKKPKETDMTKLSDEELVKLQLSDNEWLVRMARWELRERTWQIAHAPIRPGKDRFKIGGLVNAQLASALESKQTTPEAVRLILRDLSLVTSYGCRAEDSLGYAIAQTLGRKDNEHIQAWSWRSFFEIQRLDNEFESGGFIGQPTDDSPRGARRYESMMDWFADGIAAPQSQFMRLALASGLGRFEEKTLLRITALLLSHPEDATDHNLPLMYWYGIRDLPPAELVKLVKDCRISLVTQFIARRITEDIDKDPAPLNTLLGLAVEKGRTGFQPVKGGILPPSQKNEKQDASRDGQDAHPPQSSQLPQTPVVIASDDLSINILIGMTDALKGWRKAKKPAAWDKFAAFIEGSAGTPARNENQGGEAAKKNEADKSVRSPLEMLRALNVLFGDGRALDEVRAVALDEKANVEARKSALATLVEAKSPDARKICEKLLSEHSLALAAVQGLATFEDPAIAEKIIKRWRNFSDNEHAAVIAGLVSRPSFARVLLKNLEGSAGVPLITREDITPVMARQIRSFNDPALTKLLAEVWGEVHESSDDKKKLIASLKTKLTPEFIARGDQSRGRALYAGICAACHKLYGEGNTIGPDLTGSGRHDIGYLIENIADPSAVVAADYTMFIVTLKDGRVLNGIISGKTDRTITVKMTGMETTVDRNDIVKQEQLPISMMPEGQLSALKDRQIADLFAYLIGNSQVPLPK